MPKPTSKRAMAAMTGFEPGSVYSMMSPAEQKRFKRWLDQLSRDHRVKEAQLSGRPFIRPKSLQEV